MSKPNKLSNTVARINLLPAGWRAGVRSFLLGKVIPYAGTSGARFDVLTHEKCVVSIRYRRKVGNHIGTLHAAAMALAAESATGFVCAMNVPDSKDWRINAYLRFSVQAQVILAVTVSVPVSSDSVQGTSTSPLGSSIMR